MSEVTILRCHARLCPQRIVSADDVPVREARALGRRNGWLTAVHEGAVWDFCPRHGTTDDRAERVYGGLPPGFTRGEAVELGGALFDRLRPPV